MKNVTNVISVIALIGVLFLSYVTLTGQGEVSKQDIEMLTEKIQTQFNTQNKSIDTLKTGQQEIKTIQKEILSKTNEIIKKVNDLSANMDTVKFGVFGVKNDTEKILYKLN